MKFTTRPVQFAAYVCPRGVFAIQCKPGSGGVEVERTFEVPFGLRNAEEAADHLLSVLSSAGIRSARVFLTIRGFGAAHQVLQLPPASDDLLTPVIERELRRLEPHLTDPVVQWLPLPDLEASSAPAQRGILATAVPRDVIAVFGTALTGAGHKLEHVAALPVAVHRLLEQFDSGTGTIATLAPLPDGGFIGFSLNGGLRLIVEPPLPVDAEHEPAALREELDLAAMFVRQQYRGVHLDRAVLVGSRSSLTTLKPQLAEHLRVPVKQVEAESLSPAGFAALGAVLDARSANPQSLGGQSRARSAALSRLEMVSVAAVFVLAMTAFWTITETVRAVRAERQLAAATRRIEQDDFGLAPVRATAAQRRVVDQASDAVRMVARDRVDLQQALASLAAVIRPPVRVDSVRLSRASDGWFARLDGGVRTTSNALAVQLLHDVYRELPQRMPVDSIRLDRLTYDDSSAAGAGGVRFQLSFQTRRAGER